MSERRNEERNQLGTYLNVFNRDTDQLMGHMADFSEGGIMLISKQAIPLGVVFHCRAILSKVVEGQGQVMFDVESRWSDHDPNLYALFNTGFKFIDISETDLKLLDEWFHEAILSTQ